MMLNEKGEVYGLGSNDHQCMGIPETLIKELTLIK